MGVACVMRGGEVLVESFVGNFEGKEPRVKPEGRRQGNIKMDLTCDGRMWTRLVWLSIGISVGLF
jgi:hypothetical protein